MIIEQLKKQISDMETELAKLKYQINIMDKFELGYPDNNYIIGSYFVDKNTMNTNDSAVTWGRCRIHKHNAEHSLQLNRETNLIGAIAEQLFPNDTWKPDWNDSKQNKFHIYQSRGKGKYEVDYNVYGRRLGIHYMSEEVAEAVCLVLNSKQVDLGDN